MAILAKFYFQSPTEVLLIESALMIQCLNTQSMNFKLLFNVRRDTMLKLLGFMADRSSQPCKDCIKHRQMTGKFVKPNDILSNMLRVENTHIIVRST